MNIEEPLDLEPLSAVFPELWRSRFVGWVVVYYGKLAKLEVDVLYVSDGSKAPRNISEAPPAFRKCYEVL